MKMKTCTVVGVLRGCNVPSSDDPLFGRKMHCGWILGSGLYLFCLISDHLKTVSFMI